MTTLLNPYIISSAFSPASISSLRLWLKGDEGMYDATSGGSLVTSDAADVKRWEDQSGQGNHFTSAGATDPIRKNNIQNGHSTLRFDAADNKVLTNTSNFATGFTAAEIFIVFKLVNYPPLTDQNTGLYHIGANVGVNTHVSWSDGTIYENFGVTGRKENIAPGTSLSSFVVYNVMSAASEWILNINGVNRRTDVANSFGFSGTYYIGRSYGDYRLLGDIAEVVMFNEKLSDVNRAAMLLHLQTKYGL